MQKVEAQDCVPKLINGLLDGYDPSFGLGSMTCNVYDTAWIACVKKTVLGHSQWLFPSSVSYILNSQSPNGGWPAHPGEEDSDGVDGILSTMAALYCLTQHEKNPLQLRHLHNDGLTERLNKATARLGRMLEPWRVDRCKAVGFEVLIPSLLELLSAESIRFDFPGRTLLLQMRDKKLSKVRPEMLYMNAPVALLHSLEAFHGCGDFSFDKVGHHKVGGSMMASPSATASYLMQCTNWDDEAEAYLRLVVSNGEGNGSGGVPSAYPSTNFEVTWVISTILEAGLWNEDAHAGLRPKILKFLSEARGNGEALVGFAPGIEPDLDDSSKASIILSLLGEPGITSRIIDYFDSQSCLKTYNTERNPSLSANCNALLAVLLDSEESQLKSRIIEKVTAYICESWANANGTLEDKWNLSGYYTAMLMSKAFIELLRTWDSARFSQLTFKLLCEKAMPVLFQCLVRTLHSQHLNGSWGGKGPREETAYAILTLSTLRTLPLAQYFRCEVISAIDRGQSFLKTSDQHELGYLWVEKVSYTSSNLTEAYINAARYTSMTKPSLGERVRNLCSAHDKDLARFASRIDGSPLSKHPRWLVLASWIDSRLYVSQLQKILANNGHHRALKEYGEGMAFRWVFSNHKSGSVLSSHLICDMIDLTMLSKNLAAMADHTPLPLNRNWPETYKNPEVCTESLQMQVHDSNKMITSEVTISGTSKLQADYHVPELEKENGWYSRSENGDVKDEGSWPTSQNTVSRLLALLDRDTTVAEAGRCARAAAQSELDRFLHAQTARMDKHERESPSESAIRVLERRQLEYTSSPATGAWRLILAFAIFLVMREKASVYWTAPLERVLQDVRDCILEILGLEHELAGLCRCSTILNGKRSKDDVTELLSYERDRLDLALRHLSKVGAEEDVVRAIEVIVDVADQTARDIECGWL